MVSLSNRTSMALFSDPLDHYSHRVRIVMCEKGVTSEIIDTDSNNLSSVEESKASLLFHRLGRMEIK